MEVKMILHHCKRRSSVDAGGLCADQTALFGVAAQFVTDSKARGK